MASSNISSDMIFEILTRVSLQTLDKCKVVHEDWRKLMNESTFMPTYCKNTHTLSGYYIQDIVANKHISQFISINHSDNQQGFPTQPMEGLSKDDTQILASSNQGILCCVRRKDKHFRYYVCKPVTNQWTALPNPKTRYTNISVGLIVLGSNPLNFKIVRISKPNHWPLMQQEYYRVEIFYSTTWEWNDANKVIIPQGVGFKTSVAVSASRSIYWLTSDDNVLVFDVDQDILTRFPLPEPIINNESYKYTKLIEFQGKLGLSCMIGESYLELWVVENSRNHSWKKERRVELNSSTYKPYITLAGFYNSDIAVMEDINKVIFYRSQDRISDVVKINKLRAAQNIFQFRSDFKRVNLYVRA